MKQAAITVQTLIKAPIEDVWKNWTEPEAVTHWNNASDEWYTSWFLNDLQPGGKFVSRVEVRDDNVGFDFEGHYDVIEPNKTIEYHTNEGRKVKITFESDGYVTMLIETFDVETEHAVELQRKGWQAVLDNFKKYTEEQVRKELLML